MMCSFSVFHLETKMCTVMWMVDRELGVACDDRECSGRVENASRNRSTLDCEREPRAVPGGIGLALTERKGRSAAGID